MFLLNAGMSPCEPLFRRSNCARQAREKITVITAPTSTR
jgi:hypothetical protein